MFVLGGAEIYRQALPVIDKLYISRVHASFPDADTFFPEVDLSKWKQIVKQSFNQNDVNEFAFDFCEYVK